jgi:hypothetical protein
MPKDLTIVMEDRPGTLADMGEALGTAGINIEGMCGFPCEGKGMRHILVEDAAAARRALEETRVEARGERQVLALKIEDRPGALGEISRRIADAGINIDLVYLAADGRLILGVDDLEAARAALQPCEPIAYDRSPRPD